MKVVISTEVVALLCLTIIVVVIILKFGGC